MSHGKAGRVQGPAVAEDLESSLDGLLRGMQERFSWPERAERFVVVDRWQSRTATFYRCRGEVGGRPDVVVKAAPRLAPERARELYGLMGRLAEGLPDGPSPRVMIPLPLGWSELPPVLCAPYVEGTDLHLLLQQDPFGERLYAGSDLRAVIARCGEALGVYHTQTVPPEENASSARSEAERNIRGVARRMLVSRRALNAMRDRIVVARRYGDFAPYNFRVALAGDVYLLDPPVSQGYDTVYRDIAGFTFELRKLIGGPGWPRGGSFRTRRRDLCNAFVEGYLRTGPMAALTAVDRWLIGMYEGRFAAGRAERRWRSGRYFQAFSYFTRWCAWVARLRVARVI